MALMEPTMVLGGVLIHVGRDLGCRWQGFFFFWRSGFGYRADARFFIFI
jgi:hypothetical protein